MAEAELLELFEKATKAARKACDIDDNGEGTAVVDASEEARCTDALRAISAVNISSTLLLSTQVRYPPSLTLFLSLLHQQTSI